MNEDPKTEAQVDMEFVSLEESKIHHKTNKENAFIDKNYFVSEDSSKKQNFDIFSSVSENARLAESRLGQFQFKSDDSCSEDLGPPIKSREG